MQSVDVEDNQPRDRKAGRKQENSQSSVRISSRNLALNLTGKVVKVTMNSGHVVAIEEHLAGETSADLDIGFEHWGNMKMR